MGKKTTTIDEFRKNIKNIRNTKGDRFIEIETEIDTLASFKFK